MTDTRLPGLTLPEHVTQWVADVERRYPEGTPGIGEMFTKDDLRDFDEGGMSFLNLLDFGYRRTRDLKRGIKQDADNELHMEGIYKTFAEKLCNDIGPGAVDDYLSRERDADERLIYSKPSKNSLAKQVWRAMGGRSRQYANDIYDQATKPERLAALGLTNQFDELSSHMRRTRRR